MRTLLVIVGLLLASHAYACSCLKVPEEEVFSKAQSVFLARVTSTVLVPGQEPRVHALFEVLQVFKGDPRNVKALESGTSENMCSLGLLAGESYIIYAGAEPTTAISICGHSRWFNQEREQQWLSKHRAK